MHNKQQFSIDDYIVDAKGDTHTNWATEKREKILDDSNCH